MHRCCLGQRLMHYSEYLQTPANRTGLSGRVSWKGGTSWTDGKWGHAEKHILWRNAACHSPDSGENAGTPEINIRA